MAVFRQVQSQPVIALRCEPQPTLVRQLLSLARPTLFAQYPAVSLLSAHVEHGVLCKHSGWISPPHRRLECGCSLERGRRALVLSDIWTLGHSVHSEVAEPVESRLDLIVYAAGFPLDARRDALPFRAVSITLVRVSAARLLLGAAQADGSCLRSRSGATIRQPSVPADCTSCVPGATHCGQRWPPVSVDVRGRWLR